MAEPTTMTRRWSRSCRATTQSVQAPARIRCPRAAATSAVLPARHLRSSEVEHFYDQPADGSRLAFTGGTDGGTISLRDKNHVFRFCPQGVGSVQWTATAHQSESAFVLTVGHNVWRGRAGQF